MKERRYDLDWIRIFALGLLIVYHAVITFQPWGVMILFITNKEHLKSWWFLMAAFNVWRIPILFLVAGLAYNYSLKYRNWKKVLKERNLRLGIPLLIPFFFNIIDNRPTVTCSPDGITKSVSKEGLLLISSIYYCNWLVTPAIADKTTMILFFLECSLTILATFLILNKLATEVPPNFITIMLID